jgi:aspartyl-tRNA(Asn)/glutamyl-tRNA(Gln) amidotransferase subunit A
VKDRFDRIQTRDSTLHFCEDFAVSGPVDRAQVLAVGQGPLVGRTIGLKSNIRVAGQAWTAGIGARAGQIAKSDAQVVSLLRGAGALILSRLAMDEGALGAATDNPHFGRCENPVWPGHSAGGSSGGSAAAVAAGAVDAALGSDTMGSVRIPAAYCGVYGLKTGAGVLAMEGVVPLAPSLDALGLFARTPAVLGHVLDVLCPAPQGACPPIEGWIAPDRSTLAACHPDVMSFYDEIHAALGRLLGPHGASPAMDWPGLRGDAFILTEVEAVTSLGGEAGLSAGLAKLIDYGRHMPPQKLKEAADRLHVARCVLRAALGASRVLVLPAVAQPAFVHGTRPPAGQADFTVIANIAGVPALSIPRPDARPPVSVQLTGPQGSERALIDLAARLSAAL